MHSFRALALFTSSLAISTAGCSPSLSASTSGPPAAASIDIHSTADIVRADEAHRYFETARLYAAYKCAGAETKLRAGASGSGGSGLGPGAALGTAGIVIGALGVLGGITTAVVASTQSPELPSVPPGATINPDDVSVKGKGAVIGIGIGTAVAVAGAALVTVLVVGKSGSDDQGGDQGKRETDALVAGVEAFKRDCANPLPDRLQACSMQADQLAAGCDARLR